MFVCLSNPEDGVCRRMSLRTTTHLHSVRTTCCTPIMFSADELAMVLSVSMMHCDIFRVLSDFHFQFPTHRNSLLCARVHCQICVQCLHKDHFTIIHINGLSLNYHSFLRRLCICLRNIPDSEHNIVEGPLL